MIQLAFPASAFASLPVVPIRPAARTRASAAGTILVVEDELLVCELAADALSDAGYRVLTAADAQTAEAMLAHEAIDLLFTDIDLARGTDGLTLARCARLRLPHLPVIYTSGGRDALSPDEAVSDSHFVAKPYRPSHVAALATRLLRREPGRA